jgi:cell division protein FtsB
VRRRKSRSTTLWIILICVVCLFLLLRVLPHFLKTIHCYIKESKEVNRLEKEIEKLKKENREMERRIKELKEGKGWEEEARKQGWVREGEILIRIEGKLPEKKEEKAGLLQKFLSWFEKGKK